MTEPVVAQERDALAELAFSLGAKYANRLLVRPVSLVPPASARRTARDNISSASMQLRRHGCESHVVAGGRGR